MNIRAYWQAALAQQPEAMAPFFHADAQIDWPNTNERYTVSEFIRVNCQYPGSWQGNIVRFVETEGLIITVVKVFPADHSCSFHVTSFFQIESDKILHLEEYWGDDGPPPCWRQEMNIGRPIP